MQVSVLGPVEVALDGAAVDLGTPKQRALVAALALSRGWPVSVDGIVDLLWGDDAPPAVTATLQGYVSQLRRVLEPGRQRRAPATVLVTVAPGYALRVPDDDVDACAFERAVVDAHRALQGVPVWGAVPLEEAELLAHGASLERALARWRGTPYVELGDADAAVAERARLEELRLVALEDRAVVELALGRHATLAAELEALTAGHPLRERLWALWSVALTRSGRQADALDALARVRTILGEELGLEPSAELRELQTAVLRQDPGLEWVPPLASRPPKRPLETLPEGRFGGLDAPAPAPAPPAPVERVAPWPMIGRDDELAGLVALVDRADAGAPSYAVLTGEPGIGKSRLAAELVAEVRRRGVLALVGRCSQDDGAPPLWPWKSVLDGLGVSLLDEGAEQSEAGAGEGGQFRAWERIVDAVRRAAEQRTLVVVLDDLHWADPSTLRVLRLLVETVDRARLLVVTTWRSQPEPTGLLAEVSAALAKMHAARVALGGLPDDQVAEVFASVAGRPVDRRAAAGLRDRTDGNPFFLVELARLGDRGRADDQLPGAVTDVITQRLARLPDQTVAVLRSAAVIGRAFDTETLATITGTDEDDLLDVVEPAQAAGLVREDGIDRFLFSHALVRDTLRAQMSVSRRARAHARVAEVLTGVRGRETEVAQHWRESGPSYADRAWRAAVEAAALARQLFAYDEAAELLRGALVSLEGDAEAGPAERHALLMALVDAYRWAADLPLLVGAVEEAIEVGKAMRDPEAVARAAIATTEGVLWRSAGPGQVNEAVVAALRGSLERLPTVDSDLRCRTMLALANELYDSVSFEERRALCEEGRAMARRLGDACLLMHACLVSFVALWTVQTVQERLALVDEAVHLARATGSDRSLVVASCLRAAVLNELGDTERLWPAIAAARVVAEDQRIAFGEMVLDGIELPWHAMAGRFEECERLLDHIRGLDRRLSHNNVEEALMASELALRVWQGRSLEMVPVLEAFDASPYPFAASIAVYLWRAGAHDRARAVYAERGAPLDHENDISLLAWVHAAELSLYLGDASLAADVYARLAPLAGLVACAGSTLALGPVDAYLALAAAAVGERGLAGGHADAALDLATRWDLPVFADWLRETRAAYDF